MEYTGIDNSTELSRSIIILTTIDDSSKILQSIRKINYKIELASLFGEIDRGVIETLFVEEDYEFES